MAALVVVHMCKREEVRWRMLGVHCVGWFVCVVGCVLLWRALGTSACACVCVCVYVDLGGVHSRVPGFSVCV